MSAVDGSQTHFSSHCCLGVWETRQTGCSQVHVGQPIFCLVVAREGGRTPFRSDHTPRPSLGATIEACLPSLNVVLLGVMQGMSRKKTATMFILAGLTILVGVSHFTSPQQFVDIMPPWIPLHLQLVWLSGFFEILGGVGLLIPQTRRYAAWGLIALYVAVFPANIHMALNNVPFNGQPVPPVLLWLRLPMQAVFVGVAYWFTRE